MPDPNERDAIGEVLAFWFSPEARARWFDSTPDFDVQVARALLPWHTAAAEGRLSGWAETARGCLALAILLDQVPRNVFRGRTEAYATDHLAREAALHAIHAGLDRELSQVERMILYLPLEHCEDLDVQETCVRLMAQLDEAPEWVDYARKHRDVIARFGRFPHRNAVLARASRPEEEAFLRENGAGW